MTSDLCPQVNVSQSAVAGLVEVCSGRRSLWAWAELEATEGGCRQAVELQHSFPQVGGGVRPRLTAPTALTAAPRLSAAAASAQDYSGEDGVGVQEPEPPGPA